MKFQYLLALVAGLSSCRRETGVLINDSKPVSEEQTSNAKPEGTVPDGMAWIPAGTFLMGTDSASHPVEGPSHKVALKGFYMDITEVTNAQFQAFVDATHYVTLAEKAPSAAEFPDAPPDMLKPGANHFTGTKEPVSTAGPQAEFQWWEYKIGANWKQPDGPGSSISGKENLPVVCVCWDDATAYAKWAGKRLPTEAEWERAARGGLEGKRFVWGDEFAPGGKLQGNMWQGEFPNKDSAEDGFHGLAAVKSYAPNGYGLYDMSGNVWEWVSDWFSPTYYSRSPERNPPGPAPEPDTERGGGAPCKVIRGGSWLCNDCYCEGYRPAARQWTTPDTSANHTGFRCVKDA